MKVVKYVKNRKRGIFTAGVSFFLIFIAIYSAVSMETTNNVYIKDGVLDLSDLDLQNSEPMFINGKWEFYWGKLLSPKEFIDDSISLNPSYEKIPSTWTKYKDKNGNNLKSEGKATYRLKVKLSEGNQSLGIKINNIWGNAKLFINEEGMGLEELKYANGEKLKTVDTKFFNVKSQNFDIIIQIENDDVLKSGILKSVYIGSLQSVLKLKEKFFFFDIIGIIGSFMMTIYFLGTTVQRKDFKSSHLLAIYSLLTLIFVALSDEMIILYIFPNLKMAQIYAATLPMGICYIYIFLRYVKYNYDVPISYKFLDYYKRFIIIFTILILTTPLVKIVNIGYVEAFIGIFFIIWGIYILLRSIISKSYDKKVSFLSLLSIMLMLFIGIYNTYSKKQINNLIPIYLLTFTISEGMALSYRYSNFVNEIENLSKKLKILDKRKDEFLEKTSHELKTPLQSIVNISNSLMEGVAGTLSTRQIENVGVISTVAQKLDILVDDILDYSNFMNGYTLKEEKPVNIKSQLIFVINLISYSIKDKPIVIENRIKAQGAVTMGDEKRIRQVFYNLFNMILTYTDRGRIIVRLDAIGNEAVIYIWNRDKFVNEDESIFNDIKWINDENVVHRSKNHSAIGLFVAKEIVNLHGGKISFKSTKREGTFFKVSLPITAISDADEDGIVNNISRTNSLRKGKVEQITDKNSILILEPNVAKERVMINSLIIAGYEVNSLKSVKEFLELLDRGINGNLLIINAILPENSGYELLKEVRKKYNNVDLPILMIVDGYYADNISLALHLGANDVIMESDDLEVLKTRVSTLIKLKESFSALVNSEMDFLKAQIKPHFIFNVLSVISSLIVREPHKAKKILLDFSDYLRSSFDFTAGESLTPISREIDLVKTYVAIEQERFGDRLNVDYYIEENINIKIPPLIIQPIIENSIRHGVLKKIEGGHVKLKIYKEQNEVIIKVKDDGIGIDSYRLSGILEGKDEKSGVGVKNINNRLIKTYGNGLIIDSNLGQGTEVTIRIPCDK